MKEHQVRYHVPTHATSKTQSQIGHLPLPEMVKAVHELTGMDVFFPKAYYSEIGSLVQEFGSQEIINAIRELLSSGLNRPGLSFNPRGFGGWLITQGRLKTVLLARRNRQLVST